MDYKDITQGSGCGFRDVDVPGGDGAPLIDPLSSFDIEQYSELDSCIQNGVELGPHEFELFLIQRYSLCTSQLLNGAGPRESELITERDFLVRAYYGDNTAKAAYCLHQISKLELILEFHNRGMIETLSPEEESSIKLRIESFTKISQRLRA